MILKLDNFSIKELVPEQVYLERGDKAIELLDQQALAMLNQLRKKLGRWFESDDTQKYVSVYLCGYRTPSRSWPLSHAKAMLSQKFAKLVVENEPELAISLGIAE